jgi:hypothetical protein
MHHLHLHLRLRLHLGDYCMHLMACADTPALTFMLEGAQHTIMPYDPYDIRHTTYGHLNGISPAV